MESDDDTWMEMFHESAQREDRENKNLREMVEHLAVRAEEGDLVRRENERLRRENERIDRERRQYQEEMEEFKQFVKNNLPQSRSAQKTGSGKTTRQSYLQEDDRDDGDKSKLSSVSPKTPSGYERATASDPDVFLRKSRKTAEEHPKKRAACTDSTESEKSDDEEPLGMTKSKSSTPWSLKREKRVVGKEMLQKRMSCTRKKDVTPESFSGDVNLTEYLSQFEACAEWNGWTERQKVQQLFLSLRGRARGAIRQGDEWKTISYQDLVKRLEAMFGGREEMYLAQLKGRQQQSQESIQDFAQAVRKLTDSAYAGMPEQSRNRIARDHFLENLRDREVRSAVHLARPTTMEDAVRSALETEAFLATERQRHPKYTRVIATTGEGEGETMTEVLNLLKKLVEQQELQVRQEHSNNCRGNFQTEEVRASTPSRYANDYDGGQTQDEVDRGYGGGRGRRNTGCYQCGAYDHFIAVCPYIQSSRRSMPGANHPGNDSRSNRGAREGSKRHVGAPTQQERQ